MADTEDDDPDEAIILNLPADKIIADWEHETDAGTTTAAAENPDYPADEQLIIVAFRDAIATALDNWQGLDSDTLFEQVAEHDINQYGFPEDRLEQIEPGELDAEWLDSLAERFIDAGWDVTHRATELRLTQYDEEYRITADGTVVGEGEYREPLENIVAIER
ncbi:hypothetical protein [Halonotius pteroides]|uniref:hypothetical protein n=1 Tax=Halonotius pteroides TaxID=268735 RepID=UPI0014038D20|nr:hypothetical protein [Halonotius pteroides]